MRIYVTRKTYPALGVLLVAGLIEASQEGDSTRRGAQVATAPIAAVTAPKGTVMTVLIEIGVTPKSPVGSPFTGRTASEFKVGGFAIAPPGAPVRGITRSAATERVNFPKGSPDLVPVLTDIFIGGNWEHLNAIPSPDQEPAEEKDKSARENSGAEGAPGEGMNAAADGRADLVLAGPALQIPKGARVSFSLTKPFLTIVRLDPSAFP
jgi:hypothetical protein